MTEEEYRSLPSDEYFSNSLLKQFDEHGPKILINPIKISNAGIKFGSIADYMLFNEDVFDQKYYVSEINEELSPSYKKLLSEFNIENLKKEDINENNEYILKEGLRIISEFNIWGSVKKEDTKKEKILNKLFFNYLVEKIESKNKEVITTEVYLKCKLLCKSLKTNEFTKDYITSKDLKKKQILFQVPIIYEIEGNKFKSLLDIIIIDHENKTIRAVDLKTGKSSCSKFSYDFFYFRYDIQAALYTQALEQFIIDKGFKDYSILEPLYIYVSRDDVENPENFLVDEDILKGAFFGFISKTGKEYKGILELVNEIKWHRENKKYKYSKKYYTNGFNQISYNFVKRINSNNSNFNILNNLNRRELRGGTAITSENVDRFRELYEQTIRDINPNATRRRSRHTSNTIIPGSRYLTFDGNSINTIESTSSSENLESNISESEEPF